MNGGILLWLRWTWRDLRQRWVQVVAIAVIIAIGSGVYAGLSSNTAWRQVSYDASYEALAVHDLLATTAESTFAAEGELAAAVDAMEHPEWVQVAEERLVVPTQVDAGDEAGGTLLVPGRIVGVDVSGGGPEVDRLELVGGRALEAADDGEPLVLLDSHFVEHHELPDTGTITVSGGAVDYVGNGYSPEYFMVASETVSFLAEAGFAVMFAPIGTVQALSGRTGEVNQLAVRLADGVDRAAAQDELATALAEVAPDVAVQVTPIDEERTYRNLYDDIDGDQRLFNIFALLILGGAAFAAFNLTNRIVEAQRREIGIGMALGLDRWKIAVRPLLMGVQVGLIGIVVGVGFGLWVGKLMSDLNLAFLPLPVWIDDFQPGRFLLAAGLAFLLVAIATVIPVARAVRVDPIDAIHTRPSVGGSGGLVPLLHKVPLPGNSIGQFPFRNVVRQPRRTLLTVLGIGAALAVLIGVTGMIDSFTTTIDAGEEAILGDAPDRATVTLDFFYPPDAEVVTDLATVPEVASIEPQLDLGGTFLGPDDTEIDSLIQFVPFDSATWTPTVVEGSLDTDGGIVIAQKAADDLGVAPGDTVRLSHPLRQGLGYTFVESDVPVAAIHPNPYRFVSYMSLDDADLMGMEGLVNAVSVRPADGVTLDQLKEALFGRPGVAAVEGINEVAGSIRDTLEELLGFLAVLQAFVLLMALLIAFNTSSISSDERRREHATMFAFGLPTRTVMRLMVTESVLLGGIGTLVGIVVGRVLLAWLVGVLLPDTVPDLQIRVDVAASTYLTALILGVVAVAVAPLLTWRRLKRMDIPSTLRVVE